MFFSSQSLSPYTTWLSKISDADALLAPLGKVGLVTVDMGGGVRLWETGLESLQQSLQEWRNMIGQEDGRPVQVGLHKAEMENYEFSAGKGIEGRAVLKNTVK